jgi:hypothetical protein
VSAAPHVERALVGERAASASRTGASAAASARVVARLVELGASAVA